MNEEIGVDIEVDTEQQEIPIEVKSDVLKGDKGDKGEKGDPTATIEINQVITGEPGTSVIIENVGTDVNMKLDITIPRGYKGDKPLKGIDYYTEVDKQELINEILSQVNQFSVEVVSELPTEEIKETTIYFVPKENSKQKDVYDEYIYINNDWEHIGTTEIDLSNYYNKVEVDSKVQGVNNAVQGINNKIDNLSKNYTGTNITASTCEGFGKIKKIYGYSNQATRSGKNILNKVEIITDGIKMYFDKNKLGKIFTISLISDLDLIENTIYLDKSNGSVVVGSITGNANTKSNSTITLNDNIYNDLQSATWWNLRIYKSGATFTKVEKCQIEEGTEATDYESYGVSPSPEFPSEIKNAGDNINLFNNNKVTSMVRLSYSNGIYTASDEDTKENLQYKIQQYDSTDKFISDTSVMLNIDSTGTYYFTSKKKDGATRLRIANNGAKNEFVLKYPLDDIKVGEDFTVSINIIDITVGSSKFKDVMLVKGLIEKTYSPYGMGSINTKIVNKNLHNGGIKSGLYSASNGIFVSNSAYVCSVEKIKVKNSSTIAVSNKNKKTGVYYVIELDKNGSFIKSQNSVNVVEDFVCRLGENTEYVLIDLGNSGDPCTVEKVGDFQVEYNVSTDYVEHKEQNIQFLTTKPLYKDCYLADDGIHYTRKQIVLDGSENWEVVASYQRKRFQLTLDNSKSYLTSQIPNIICNYFKANSADNIYKGESGIGFNGKVMWIDDAYGSTIDGYTLGQWKNWLANNPITLEYELAEEVIEPYTDDISMFITQYDNKTNISNSDNSEMEIELTNNKTVSRINENAKILQEEIIGYKKSIKEELLEQKEKIENKGKWVKLAATTSTTTQTLTTESLSKFTAIVLQVTVSDNENRVLQSTIGSINQFKKDTNWQVGFTGDPTNYFVSCSYLSDTSVNMCTNSQYDRGVLWGIT